MPQVTGDQARIAQAFTLWFNNLNETSRVDALCVTAREAAVRWAEATGTSIDDLDIALDLIVDGVIEVEGGRFLRTRAWS